jgi:hypothetical protein
MATPSNPTRDALLALLTELGKSNIDDYAEAFEMLRDRLVGRDGEEDPELDARFRSAMGRLDARVFRNSERLRTTHFRRRGDAKPDDDSGL